MNLLVIPKHRTKYTVRKLYIYIYIYIRCLFLKKIYRFRYYYTIFRLLV
jgi:hypothetical protein